MLLTATGGGPGAIREWLCFPLVIIIRMITARKREEEGKPGHLPSIGEKGPTATDEAIMALAEKQMKRRGINCGAGA